MADTLPKVLFPEARVAPWHALVRRIGIALGILVLVTVVTWLGRHGHRDVDGTPVGLLDALYYSSVTLTTTGYGDITPVSSGARAMATFVITPARILFLIALVGTTLELLTERFRKSLAESRWRTRVTDHTIVVGYGTKGRGAIDTMLADGIPKEMFVVVDNNGTSVAEAREEGYVAVLGDATRTAVLLQARVAEASRVVVVTRSDDTATLVTLTAREMNARATIVAAVREAENAHLLRQSGADTVIVSSEAAGRLLGLATSRPRSVALLEDLLDAGHGVDVDERTVSAEEVGGPPRGPASAIPVAVVRGGLHYRFTDPEFARTEAGDIVVSIVSV